MIVSSEREFRILRLRRGGAVWRGVSAFCVVYLVPLAWSFAVAGMVGIRRVCWLGCDHKNSNYVRFCTATSHMCAPCAGVAVQVTL